MPMTDAPTHTYLRLIQHHRAQPPSVGLDADGAERFQAIVGKLEQLALPVAAEVERIMHDPTLTPEGQTQQRRSIGPRVVNNFKNVGVVLNQADQAKTRVEKLLFDPITKKPAGDPVVTFLREDAIRRTVGKAQAGAELIAAADRLDVETMRALLDAPGKPMIDENTKQRAYELYATKTAPETWQQLQSIEHLRDNLSGLAGQTAQWLLHLGASREAIQQVVTPKD